MKNTKHPKSSTGGRLVPPSRGIHQGLNQFPRVDPLEDRVIQVVLTRVDLCLRRLEQLDQRVRDLERGPS
ncbi:hypothetical protein ES703_99352 [subsurface metagenome]